MKEIKKKQIEKEERIKKAIEKSENEINKKRERKRN